MKQFGTILGFELKSYFKNKVFIGLTIALVAIIAVLMFFPRIMFLFQGEGDKETDKVNGVMLLSVDETENTGMIQQAFEAAFTDYAVIVTEDSIKDVKEQVMEEEAACAFVITSDTSYEYYVNNLSLYDANTMIADEVLQNLYCVNAMAKSGMTQQDIQEALQVQIESVTTSLGKDQTQNFLYTYVMIFALYMVILLYGQMVATAVATEKSSRAMELLITSAKPVSMMFGKVIAACLAGMIQLVAVFGSAILCYNLNKAAWEGNMMIASLFDMPLSLLVYMLVFFVLGFFMYAFMFGAIGSMASKVEDINTTSMPVVLLFVAGFMVVISSMSSGSVDTTLMKVCSYIPFTSPMAMFTRIAMSTVPFYEVIISIIILIVSVVLIGVCSAKIYRMGVLLYGKTPKIGSLIKTVWKA